MTLYILCNYRTSVPVGVIEAENITEAADVALHHLTFENDIITSKAETEDFTEGNDATLVIIIATADAKNRKAQWMERYLLIPANIITKS